jgi:hypothetical protein
MTQRHSAFGSIFSLILGSPLCIDRGAAWGICGSIRKDLCSFCAPYHHFPGQIRRSVLRLPTPALFNSELCLRIGCQHSGLASNCRQTSSSFFLDAMLGEMKEGDASRNAEFVRLRRGGRAKDSTGYRYSFSSLKRLHCLRDRPT